MKTKNLVFRIVVMLIFTAGFGGALLPTWQRH